MNYMSILPLHILIDIHELTGTDHIRMIVAMESIIFSTKTKAKDFLDGSTSFKQRVVKKFMRTKFLHSEESANKLFDLYQNLSRECKTENFSFDNFLLELEDVYNETNMGIE